MRNRVESIFALRDGDRTLVLLSVLPVRVVVDRVGISTLILCLHHFLLVFDVLLLKWFKLFLEVQASSL